MVEDYVSFETAKLLKDKGFDIPVERFYNECGTHCCGASAYNWNDDDGEDCSRPTLQMAMKWLREVHKLHIILDIHWLHFANQNGWMYTITRILENGNEYIDSKGDENDKNFYHTYEEACEEAIKYCLENLI